VSWRLRVVHATTFAYEGAVQASYNEARISPTDTASQFTLEHRVEVNPAVNLFRYRDYWGTRVHAFDLHQEHEGLRVVATSLVETAERSPSLDDTVPWDAVEGVGLTDRLCEYLAPTTATQPDGAILELAMTLRGQPSPAQAIHTTGEWLRSNLEYRQGTTTVSTTAAETFAARRGVCQDFVHLGLSVLRGVGIPARYASGYLYPDDGGAVGETHAGQSHAWLEAWVGDWVPVDPTSGVAVAERHVLVARGRDYTDVPPLKGIYQGGSSTVLTVGVELTRVA
jgi:transglutaminase-like putative cysteine protease